VSNNPYSCLSLLFELVVEFELVDFSHPLPYTCKITPRFPEAPALLMEETEVLKA
jgi:hypothetical protein